MLKRALAVFASFALAAVLVCAEEPATAAVVKKIKVQSDKAPDCSSLKSIVETVTRGCANNDAKAIAIYNFMLMTFYHQPYAVENGGVPAIKVINCYGWGVCGGTHSVQSALWRQLGWGWRFIGWPGHTTVEAEYDGGFHYFDAFLKFYAWMPDGKGGRTVAGEYDLQKNKKELIDDAFVYDQRKIGYFKTDAYEVINGKPNWQARDIMACDAQDCLQPAPSGGLKFAMPKLSRAGSPDSWAGYNHSDGNYSTDVNLAPGFALTNTWDAIPDAWYWNGKPGNIKQPGHSCGNHKDTRNSPGIGLVIEPYVADRSYGNGTLTFAPDFSSDAFLKSLLSSDNVKYADKTLVPAETGKSGSIVFQLASPYIITKACGEAAGAETVEVSVDDGKTFKAVDPKNFDALVKGRMSAQVKIAFKEALKSLKFDATVQNNPFALPYLSPGKNVITVSVADPKALGDNKLAITYAYLLGARTSSYEQLCEKKARIALRVDAKWDEKVTYAQKIFSAKDLPATFEIDCPTPKGQYPVYPRMIFVRREVLSSSAKPLPLPEGAVEAKPAQAEELQTLPNPFLLGTTPPPLPVPAPATPPAEPKAPETPPAK